VGGACRQRTRRGDPRNAGTERGADLRADARRGVLLQRRAVASPFVQAPLVEFARMLSPPHQWDFALAQPLTDWEKPVSPFRVQALACSSAPEEKDQAEA
jgi:hypothetical protein